MIKVSVIVPVYNAEKYLAKCLDSLISQTLEEIEIIAVDDGSTDSSPGMLAGYAAKSSKLRHFTRANGGAADARNFGLTRARGEYVGYVDSDDFVDLDMFEIMFNKARERDSDIVECDLRHTYAGGEDKEAMSRYYTPGELLCFGRYIVWNKIFRRDLLIEADAHFPAGFIYEDVAFVAKILPYISGYDYVDAAPIHYVQRRSSVNNSKSVKTMDILAILDDITSFFAEKGFRAQYERELEYLFARILLCSSFERMCRIPDRELRKTALERNYGKLVESYPLWRKNPVLRAEKSRNASFMRMQTPPVHKICCAVFPVLLRIKNRFSPEWE